MAKRKKDPQYIPSSATGLSANDFEANGLAVSDHGAKRPVRRGDMIASIVLVIVAVIVNVVVTALAVWLVLLSDSCNVTCNYTVIQGGWIFAMAAPSILTIVGIFITIFRVIRRRLAFWVPLTTMGAAVLALVIGTTVMILGIPGAQIF